MIPRPLAEKERTDVKNPAVGKRRCSPEGDQGLSCATLAGRQDLYKGLRSHWRFAVPQEPSAISARGIRAPSGDRGKMDDDDRSSILPAHIHQTVRALAELHAEHQRRATPLLRLLNMVTGQLGRPRAIAAFGLFAAVWIGTNLTLPWAGVRAFDAPPFYALDTILSISAVSTTLVILATQQHESRLSENRSQLTLELAILSEQKSAKIIEMLDALRRDMPNVATVVDDEAIALSMPADPQSMLNALDESRRAAHDELGG